ncbi:MAG: cobalamin-dependent protein [Polyangiales bacterium]
MIQQPGVMPAKTPQGSDPTHPTPTSPDLFENESSDAHEAAAVHEADTMMSEAASDPLSELKTRYLNAQLAGNRREALRLVRDDGVARGASIVDLQVQVIQAAQREIGRLWQENRISVAQEHMATAISQMALAQLYDEAQRAPSNDKRVLVACVQGELHDFPARLVADTLDLAGFEVRYLGADIPTDNLLDELATYRPDLLALSATMDFNLPALRSAVLAVRKHPAGQLPIVIGGSACAPLQNLAAELGVEGAGADANAMIANARRLLGLLP